jgi:hypothetical protein
VLDASTRVDASARSGLIDVHFAFVVDQTLSTPCVCIRLKFALLIRSLGVHVAWSLDDQADP